MVVFSNIFRVHYREFVDYKDIIWLGSTEYLEKLDPNYWELKRIE